LQFIFYSHHFTMPSLSDKLKSLGVRVGAQDLPAPRQRSRHTIEEVIDGRYVDTPYGLAFIVEQHYSPEYQQGRSSLQVKAPLDTIATWAGEPRLRGFDPRGFVYIDTETSGLAGGSGTFAFLIGAGRSDDAGFHLAQCFLRNPLEEPAQLAALGRFLGECAGLVTFNGKAFDVPILNARYVLNGDISPFMSSPHLDLLPLARRLWRDRLESRALGFLEKHILGLQRTEEDVPGFLVPQLYFNYLKDGDARPLKSVFYHNAMDVISMAALLNHIAALLEDPFNAPVDDPIDLIALAKMYEDQGDLASAVKLYEQGLVQQLPPGVRANALERWSGLEKRRGNYPQAIALWQQAAAEGLFFAHVELAKYAEHRLHHPQSALNWTRAALELVNMPELSLLEKLQWQAELEHREARLLRKIESRSSIAEDYNDASSP
jgi:uncharacterized protein YprB with RNaseH-like and TPR domain